MKTDYEHNTLKTEADSEEDVTPALPTDPASNDNGAIVELENEVNNDRMEEKEAKIVQSMLETASKEEGIPSWPVKPTLLVTNCSNTIQNNYMEEETLYCFLNDIFSNFFLILKELSKMQVKKAHL